MITKDDYTIIAKYLYRYSSCKPSIAIQRLLNIDIFRNNYTKTTIYNLLIGARRALKDGQKNKYFSQTIFNLLLDMKEKKIYREVDEQTMNESTMNESIMDESIMDTQKPAEAPKPSIEEMIEEIKKQKEKLKEVYEKTKEEKEQLINNIKKELEILHSAYAQAEVDLSSKEVNLTAKLLHQLITTIDT